MRIHTYSINAVPNIEHLILVSQGLQTSRSLTWARGLCQSAFIARRVIYLVAKDVWSDIENNDAAVLG
jgi:hypothetical protein